MSDQPITVNLIRMPVSGLWVATSPDVPGLYIAGRSREQVEREVPSAIAEMEDAQRVLARPSGPDDTLLAPNRARGLS